MTAGGEHHYALDAASLLDGCRRRLRAVMDDALLSSPRWTTHLSDLDGTLHSTERLIHFHLLTLLERDEEEIGRCGGEGGIGVGVGVGVGRQRSGSFGRITEDAGAGEGEGSVGGGGVNAGVGGTGSDVGGDRGRYEETLMGTAKRLGDVAERKRKLARRRTKYQHAQQLQHHQRWGGGSRRGFGHNLHGRYGRRHNTSARFGTDVDSHFPPDLKVLPQSRFGGPSYDASQRAGDSSSSFGGCGSSASSSGSRSIHPNRSAEDSLLFRLIVVLQLCQVRVDDADRIICGRRIAERRTVEMAEVARRERRARRGRSDSVGEDCGGMADPPSGSSSRAPSEDPRSRGVGIVKLLGVGVVGMGAAAFLGKRYEDREERRAVVVSAGKAVAAAAALATVRRGWVILGMSARLAHSATALEDWQHQWVLVQSIGSSSASATEEVDEEDEDGAAAEGFVYQAGGDITVSSSGGGTGGGNARSNRLLELIESQGTTSSVWHSYGAVRFMLIKRAMDTLYASVGVAMSWMEKQERLSRFWMPVATAAAASYYTLTGPGTKSAEVVSSSSPDFIKKAWGVVSLPAVKHLSLQASRILKGAAIAERIMIADVPCIILCRNPCQPVATALKRFWRQQEREMSHLSTILEKSSRDLSIRQRAVNVQDYPKKNVILHLTGGGFFAHTIAGDLPYLLDWSGASDAVVIVPEYALLPEHNFPVAIEQICTIYCLLLSGDAAPLLGFRTDRIIITGEAAGGNLAAALCVKLCMDQIVDVAAITAKRDMAKAKDGTSSIGENLNELQSKSTNQEPLRETSPAGGPQCEHEEDQQFDIRLPDGLMLCCPALNMCLELTPSRVRGTNDPVLPSGLIKAISDGYLPPQIGFDKTDPVASPYYSPDEILRVFPPTFICESTEDPLLDDSVSFNARLRKLGVESDLRAAHDMPHAYWGLSTAGFPEATQVHTECQNWLVRRFRRGSRRLAHRAVAMELVGSDRGHIV